MPRFNHAYTLAFSVISNERDGRDVTSEMFSAALRRRADDLDTHKEWDEAVGCPFDTSEEDVEEDTAQ